ncbi:MAG: ABC transporter ATP-binding protein [Candidatus Thermoplasmatota archaeon]|jgi:ABC-2 type transport system ATP-binding protein|nr:ABC transporter ATP-binding protein [Candidatus Thermoplasmatota archaeon]
MVGQLSIGPQQGSSSGSKPSEYVIVIRDLYKTYGKVNAVDGISLRIRKGEVFAFLGPNGAGKTTTVEIIEGIRTPTKGSIQMLGVDIGRGTNKVKHRIGVLPQEFSSFDRVTVTETISFFSSLYGNKRGAKELMKLLNIEEHAKKQYQKLSGGLKQRVGIAVSLVNDPEIIFLDEPTTGLDPASRQEVWEVIRKLKARGRTVFLTTHYMEEAQELADHVAIINRGKIIAEGTVDELIENHGSGLVLTFTGIDGKLVPFLNGMGCGQVQVKGSQAVMNLKNKDQILGILELVKGSGLSYRAMNVRRSNLEEVFLKLTGKALKDEEGRQ